jgi:hypothetical protein
MGRLELDKWDIKRMHDLKNKGRLDLQPEYQRGNVWDDARRYGLIDTVIREWPMGLILLKAYDQEDEEGNVIEYFEVVDGQQRLTTLFDYIDGEKEWTDKVPTKFRTTFQKYQSISVAKQTKVDEYKLSIAFMRDYDESEILDIYSRLQTGKALNIGEKIKALRTEFKEYLKELVNHKLFTFGQHKFRDAHWNLSAQYFKAVYLDDPLTRVEYQQLEDFLKRTNVDQAKAEKARGRVSSIMSYEYKALTEAININKDFENTIYSARTLKWIFAVLMKLNGNYSINGKEHLFAKGILEYYKAKEKENTPEWTAYMRTGRSGRMDTDDVKLCLNQLMGYVINSTNAQPLDNQRWFSSDQRQEIWNNSKGKCQGCGMELSKTNFHADHVVPYTAGGETSVKNGQALCAQCNWVKGSDSSFKNIP